MSEELTTETESTEETTGNGTQGIETTGEGTLSDAAGESGASTEGTTGDGTQDSAEETFFNPADLDGKPELQAAYKNMQRAFSKRMSDLSTHRQKIEAYDSFNSDPIKNMSEALSRMGYQVVPQNANAPSNEPQNEDPQSWDDVYSKATQAAKAEIMREFGPIINQVQGMRKSAIENQLAELDPTWQQYEPDMQKNLKSHPSLANDPAMLYRMSVPASVLESRATQAALKKLQAKTDSSKVSGATTTKTPGTEMPNKPMSFQESVDFARKQLASQGLSAPG